MDIAAATGCYTSTEIPVSGGNLWLLRKGGSYDLIEDLDLGGRLNVEAAIMPSQGVTRSLGCMCVYV